MHPTSEQRHILKRATSSLADIVLVEKEPGYTAHRSTCPDGQFWLPIRGEQVVSSPRGQRRQQPFELMYYAPREPAVRATGTRTFAYGVRIMLSGLEEHERDESWVEGQPLTWDSKRMIVGLILNAVERNADPHTIDEAVAQWIAKPHRAPNEASRTAWMTQVIDLLNDDPSLTLVELSRRVGIVPCYLSAQFSRMHGHTISSVRRQIMLERTLQNTESQTFNEAAVEAGFYDASHFHRACLAELGAKPSDLRRLIWPT